MRRFIRIILKKKILFAILLLAIAVSGYHLSGNENKNQIDNINPVYTDGLSKTSSDDSSVNAVTDIPDYDGSTSVVVLNNNVPEFSEEELTTDVYVSLSPLDELGRCGAAIGCFGPETIAKEERGSIGHIRPSGWHTIKYPEVISDLYLYNRCHLLMYKVSGILDDERNLITGTRYLNVESMLPLETKILDYIYETNNHVVYRVTPVFKGDNLVASGVKMEAYSVEDQGKGVCFNAYCYNVQPGIVINYATGESKLEE